MPPTERVLQIEAGHQGQQEQAEGEGAGLSQHSLFLSSDDDEDELLELPPTQVSPC